MKKYHSIPMKMEIETIFGCNAHCKMCTIDRPSKRKKGIMDFKLFKKIIDQMEPYRKYIQFLDLFGIGEPLLDPGIFEKIRYAKSKGFRNAVIATNADLLDEEKQDKLLDTNIDSVFLSIDGIDKKTHELIRPGVNFENIIRNVKSIIKKRNEGNYNTRFIIRFIKQKANRHQWSAYKKYWLNQISKERRDIIICYDMHSWDKEVPLEKQKQRIREIERKPCHHIFDRLIVLVDGTVIRCCGDFHHGNYGLGNIKDQHPMDIFNCAKMKRYRALHLDGKKTLMKIYRECSILYSETTRMII